MAGIAGIMSSTPFATTPLLEKMAASLRFSSRSKVETWNGNGAGLCRVRIGIDNPEKQPIFNTGQTRCIVMFGECFDYEQKKQELIHQGHIFTYRSNDAEFCLHLYEEYGEDAFATLSGSFCFAIYDMNSRELLLVSDRLGSRPLFYSSTHDGKFIFATQVSPVLCLPGVSRDLDIGAAMEFCALQRVFGEKTLHSAVKMLPPASVLRYRADRLEIKHYWQLNYDPQPASADEYAEELEAVLQRSARNLFRNGARVAMLLSGGLDSRMIVAAANDPIKCYSFGDYLNPEAEAAKNIAKIKGFEFNFLPRDSDQYISMLDTAVELGNGMHPFNHAHAVGFLNIISQHCNVITHGYAIERLFRGTTLPKIGHKVMGLKTRAVLDRTLNEKNLLKRLFHRSYNLLDDRMMELFMPDAKMILKESLRSSAQEILAQSSSHSTNIFDKYTWPDIYYHARFPSMVFEYSLRAFITERTIYMSKDAIDLHLKMPVLLRADNRVWLKAMARLNKEIARAADANTRHAPTTPMPVVSILESGKDLMTSLPLIWRFASKQKPLDMKQGHSPKSWPRFDWMICNNPKMRQAVIDTLNDPAALPKELFDHKRIGDLLTDHLNGREHHRVILFALLTFGRWHKKYVAC